jgi:galactonate dehydratase
VCASIPNLRFLEHRAEDVAWRATVAPGVVPDVGGEIEVPDRPGLGIDVDEAECARHPVREVGDYQYRFRTPDRIQQDRA